jgi:hypothetical protein
MKLRQYNTRILRTKILHEIQIQNGLIYVFWTFEYFFFVHI